MIDRNKIQLVRSVAHAVYGVDIANPSRSPTFAYPRNVAMMALHDELGLTQTEAAAAFGGEPSRFTHARERMIVIFNHSPEARRNAAKFLQILDRELALRPLEEAPT